MPTKERPPLTEAQEKTKRLFAAWYAAEDISQNKAAARLGCSGATLSAIISGVYQGDSAKYIRKMDEVLARVQAEDNAIKRPAFIATSVSEQIFGLFDTCRASRVMGFISTRSGIGKTMAAEGYVDAHPVDVIKITCCKGFTGREVVRQLAQRFLLPWHGSTATMFDEVVSQLILTGNPLLIVDEADFLRQGIHTVRQLHDQADCGLVLLGTPAFLGTLRRHRTGTEGQALGRITHYLSLDKIIAEDGEHLAAFFGVRSAAWQLAWQASGANARRLVNGLMVAARYAGGGDIGERQVADAFDSLMPAEL